MEKPDYYENLFQSKKSLLFFITKKLTNKTIQGQLNKKQQYLNKKSSFDCNKQNFLFYSGKKGVSRQRKCASPQGWNLNENFLSQ